MANSGAGGTAVPRVGYREQQVVTRADLTSEQQYLIAARRRHNIGPHLWGILSGLEVQVAGGVVSIRAGTAVDGYGRELILGENVDVPPSALLELKADRVALWLIYGRVDRVVPLTGEWNCAPGAENRTIESTRLRLTTIDPDGVIDPRQPPEVTTTGRAFAPQQIPPDDPAVLWPVFLGLIERSGAGSPWQLSTAYERRRPYAGLRGQTITAASGVARVRADHEIEGDNRAFAVETGAAGSLTEQLGIDLAGNIFLAQRTTVSPRDAGHPVDGNLQIRRAMPNVTALRRAGLAGCEESGEDTRPRFWGMRFDPIAPPKVAMPWHVYRAGVPALPPPEPPAVPFDELRLEFLDPGTKGNRKGNRVVIGTRNANGDFVRCVTIDAECTVTVNGTLRVDGQIVMGPVQADPADARLQSLLLGGWLQGMLANTRELASYYDARVEMHLTRPDRAFVDAPFRFDVRVLNTGSIPLAGVRVTETHNLSGAQATLPAAFTLDPHEQKDVEVLYTVAAPGHFTCQIGVTALAQGASYEVSASADSALDILHEARIQSEVQAQGHAVIGAIVPYVAVIENLGQAVLSRVFFTVSVDDGTVSAADLMTNSFLQRAERRPFNRTVQRTTPGNVIIKADASASGGATNNDATDSDQKTVVFHTPAQMTVMIANLGASTGTNPVPFDIVIRNSGQDTVQLTSLDLTKSLTSPDGAFTEPAVTSQVIRTMESLTLNASFTPSATMTAEALEVTVNVSVTGAGGDVVSDSDTQSNSIAIT